MDWSTCKLYLDGGCLLIVPCGPKIDFKISSHAIFSRCLLTWLFDADHPKTLYWAIHFWVVELCILIVVVFPQFWCQSLRTVEATIDKSSEKTGFGVLLVHIEQNFYVITEATVRFTVFCRSVIFCSYKDMRDSAKSLNLCLIVRRQMDCGTRGLCVRTGSTGQLDA